MAPDLHGICLEDFGREGTAVGIGQPAGLIGHDLGNRASTVTDPNDDRPTGSVEIGPAGGIPDRRALGPDGNKRGACRS